MRMRLLLATALLACAPAHAVSVSTRGTGQVLLFPYYTAEAGQQTLLTVVNPTASARALRVRFAESRNGRTVLSLSVYLGANDSWTAAVFAPDATGTARLVSFDRSCALATSGEPLAAGAPLGFSASAYTGANRDWDPIATPAERVAKLAAPERTRTGYVEVIEMGRLRGGNGPLELADDILRERLGGCASIASAWTAGNPDNWRADPTRAIDLPAGGLLGNAAIVDVEDGTMLSYAATALDDFYTVAAAPGALHAPPESARPALDDARNAADSARVRVARSGAAPVVEAFPASRAIDAVSLALMASSLRGEYNADPALAAATEWIVAFPTKRWYADVDTDAAVRAPFTEAFRDDGRADEFVSPEWRRRNGFASGFTYACIDVAAPPPEPCPAEPTLGHAVSVLRFVTERPAGIPPGFAALNADAATYVILQDIYGFRMPSGWTSVRFREPRGTTERNVLVAPGSGIAYYGLPTIALGATNLVNANVVPGVLANFGDAVMLSTQLDGAAPASQEVVR